MTQTTHIPRASLLDEEWRKKKTGGFTVKRVFKDFESVDGKTIEVLVDVEIHVFGGGEESKINEYVLQVGEDGEFLRDPETNNFIPMDDPDGSLGEIAMVAVSTGLELEDARALRKAKSGRFWNALALECNKFNGFSKPEVDAEKNGEESAL